VGIALRPAKSPNLVAETGVAGHHRAVESGIEQRGHGQPGEHRNSVPRSAGSGEVVSQALHVAAVLEISDAPADGPRVLNDLPTAVGAHERSLQRLLRALVSVGVYTRDDQGRYANTELGEELRSDAPHSVAGWATLIGRPYYRQAWAGLLDSVRTGEYAFTTMRGESIWAYRAQRPDEQAIFDRAMTALSSAVAGAVAEAYDFARFTTVVDVGGGRGRLLATILTRYPSVHGVLFDQPDVVTGAAEMLRPCRCHRPLSAHRGRLPPLHRRHRVRR